MVKLNSTALTVKTGTNEFQPRLISHFLRSTAKLRIFRHQSRDMTTLEHPGSVQLNSPLLSLPREVRDMVWKNLMGGMIIHLWIDENDGKKLRGSYCWAEEENCRLRCRAWLQKKGRVKWPTIGVYGLILSCSQAYTESIRHLYEMNSFDTRSPEVVCRLPRIFPTHRLNAIHSLTFCWTLPKPPSLSSASRQCCQEGKFDEATKGCNRYQREWVQIWGSLSTMQCLEFLRIEMNTVGRESITGMWEGSDLEIVKTVRKPATLLVVMEDESAKRMRRLINAPNMIIVGILEEEVQIKKHLSRQRD
ncbi:hypothetical protein DL98DRAFT_593948 [Cadophora sp. DSE1049]|nr:hypothetical protein DL98DRAFT_593948 [Cadophora sp. DSE1049]